MWSCCGLPDFKEAFDNPCDTGSSPEALAEEFPGLADLGYVEDGWNKPSAATTWEQKLRELEARA